MIRDVNNKNDSEGKVHDGRWGSGSAREKYVREKVGLTQDETEFGKADGSKIRGCSRD